jgi:hypothetical protein
MPGRVYFVEPSHTDHTLVHVMVVILLMREINRSFGPGALRRSQTRHQKEDQGGVIAL